MSDLLTHIGRLELVDVDLDKEPQCEGFNHPGGAFWHDAGAAKFVVTFRCECGTSVTVLKCAGMAAYHRVMPTCCHECKRQYPPDSISFIEL